MTSTQTPVERTRTVLITGSTSGIGAAAAHALAAQGWSVVVTGRDRTRGAAVVAAVQTDGGQAVFVPSDLTSPWEALHSWMAHIGHPVVGLYSATEAAELQLARSWAAEFGPRGIRVNTVSPGATRTPVNAAAHDVVAQMTASTPAGRPGTPKEIADAVSWLLSDRASYVHGAELPVDAGVTTARST